LEAIGHSISSLNSLGFISVPGSKKKRSSG